MERNDPASRKDERTNSPVPDGLREELSVRPLSNPPEMKTAECAESDERATIALLRKQIENADLDSADAWHRNDMLQIECELWKKRISAERAERAAMEKSFSWWITTPFRELARMKARLGRSLAKRIAKFSNGARSAPETAAAKEDIPPVANAQYRSPKDPPATNTAESLFLGSGCVVRPPLKKDSVPDFAVYFSNLGNYFFQEIAHLIHAALTNAGYRSVLRTDGFGRAANADFHIVVAPHEFFAHGKGSDCFDKSIKDRIFFLNTEQPQTKWFRLAESMFPYVRHIFDMDRQTANVLRSSGHSASHLPLGFVEDFAPYTVHMDLPVGPETESLSAEVRRWRDIDRPLAERPIDLSFVGEATPRRSAFFANMAPQLEKYESHLRLLPAGSGPWPAGGVQIHRRTRTTAGLSQRSKIVINIHRDQEHYFEWHRIVQMGIWQRALVLTETVTETPPFIAGRDYVQATLDEMPRLIDYYLRDPRGIEEAERIRNSGYEQLKASCNFPSLMKQLWKPFLIQPR